MDISHHAFIVAIMQDVDATRNSGLPELRHRIDWRKSGIPDLR
jgi:hypothetical protein